MRILALLNHPAHYYLFRNIVRNLRSEGIEIRYLIKSKDILENLLDSEREEYTKINEKLPTKTTSFSVIKNGFLELAKQETGLFRYVRKWKPDLMLGTDFSITHIGKIFDIPSFVFNEDDYEINRSFCMAAYPFATRIISPDCCSVGPFFSKKISYNGFQKMAYLHPRYFKPDRNEISFIPADRSYYVIRLVSLTAGHDIEGKHRGLDDKLVDLIIDKLSAYGNIFITNEGSVNPSFEKYRMRFRPEKMHHLLAFADIMIGDSQTMCAEAGLLGTPFIRYNDFVGRISYLNEIENNYGLGFGIRPGNPEKVMAVLDFLLGMKDLKPQWQEKKDKLFQEKVDVARWITDYILCYLKLKVKR